MATEIPTAAIIGPIPPGVQGLYTTLRNVQLDIVKDVGNAHLTIGYDIDFSDTDVLANQAYEQSFRLLGVDAPPEDGVDDPISLGVLVPFTTVRPNGEASVHRTIELTIPWINLDEDSGTDNPDEIQAEVRLNPIRPDPLKEQSNVVVRRVN